jgi:hypothetical protein
LQRENKQSGRICAYHSPSRLIPREEEVYNSPAALTFSPFQTNNLFAEWLSPTRM